MTSTTTPALAGTPEADLPGSAEAAAAPFGSDLDRNPAENPGKDRASSPAHDPAENPENHSGSSADLDSRSGSGPDDDADEPVEELAHPLTGDAPVEPAAPTFADLQVDRRIVQALLEAGIERTFAIQALTLPIALVGSDLIGQARTGMGKTLGFGVPMLQRLTQAFESRADRESPTPHPAPGRAPRGLVMVPTRELCVQVARDLTDAARHLNLKITAVYGGRAYEPQISALQAGVDVVVGTPGRLLDLANGGHLQLGAVRILVLDEADEMLDLGFLPDMERVLGMVPDVKQTMLFSATMPGPILTLARSFMSQPVHIRAELPAEGATHLTTKQFAYRAHALDKVEMLARVLQARGRQLAMVFARTKRTAQKVADELVERGFAAAAVHGDLGQGAREQALRAFRSGKVDVLVATDVAARGIDVEGVTHVINFQCPEDDKTYVHRIGRTGRAGRTGVAVTFVDWDEIPRWKLISEALGLGIDEPAETYSSSKHLYTDLDIAEKAGSRLPEASRTRAGLDAERLEDVGETGRRHRPTGRHESGGRHEHGDAEPTGGRSKPRRRTRSGAASGSAGSAGAESPTAADADAPNETGEPRPPRRPRRRTRSGRSGADRQTAGTDAGSAPATLEAGGPAEA